MTIEKHKANGGFIKVVDCKVEPSKEKSKLAYINSLEIERENRVEPDNREKYFITFPYPYMNGKLHLGHLFSISKSDFMSYYKELQGYNVLFPLSFHCTGMPISASAKKLKDELEGKETDISTKSIIEGLGFLDVNPFVDPIHWIRTFPTYCESSLRHFGANIDWRRSFITTDINKYYDSFIKWQFLRLRELGHLSFGKRYSIFCPIDEQPCLDHDRRKGENIKPIQTLFCKIKTPKGILLAKYKPSIVPNKIVVNRNKEFVHCELDNKSYFMEQVFYNNLKYQVKDLKVVGSGIASEFLTTCTFNGQLISVEFVDKDLFVLKGNEDKLITARFDEEIKGIKGLEDNKDMKLVETINFISIYIPEGEVISRSGGLCVVSLMDQWFIDYSDSKWKDKAKLCISKMIIDNDTRSTLLEGVDWIYKWGFSRSFGLGTRVPWDNQYLIESLSDSTIYMAMYTFKHFMYRDIEGKEEIFPSEKLSNHVWDYIFYNKDLPEDYEEYKDLLEKCRKSFDYFYPVDLRVSGKDLIKNHLLFFIFNHVALFDEKHWPRRIYTNGHLMLNSEKMSKSTGNFLTVDSCLRKYGVSATRMCLAVCGDTNEDANFIESNANSFILKIHTFIKSIEDHFSNEFDLNLSEKSDAELFVDEYLKEYLSYCITNTIIAYDKMKYSDVVKFAFFELIHLKETYISLKGSNKYLIGLIYKNMTQLLYPIMPTLCRNLIQEYFNKEFVLPEPLTESTTHTLAIEYLKTVSKRIVTSKLKKNNKSVEVLVGESWSSWKIDVMNYIDSLNVERNISLKEDKTLISTVLTKTKEILVKHKVNMKKGNLFVMDYLYNPKNYSIPFNEFEVLENFKFFICENTGLNVTIVIKLKASDDEQINSQAEPLNPTFKFY